MISGERDFFDEIVASFIQEGEFYLEDDDEATLIATEIVSLFFGLLLNELYRSEDGLALLGNRVEQIHIDTSHQLTSGFASLKAEIATLSNAVLTPEDSVNVDTTIASENSALIRNIDLARDLIDKGLIRSAHELLLQIDRDIESAPDALKFRVKTNLAACALGEDDIGTACALFEEAYEIDPSNPIGIANAAVAAHLQDDPDNAISLSNEAREIEPENSQATAVLLGALWQREDVDDLEKLISNRDWIVRDARCAQVVIGIRMEQSRIEEAIAISRDLVNSFPDDADAYLALSQCLFYRWETARHVTGYSNDLMDGLSEVVTFATQAIEHLRNTQLTLRKHTAHVVRGSAKAIMGQIDEALRDFDEVLSENPDHADAAYNKGLCLLSADRPSEARETFNQIGDSERRESALLPIAVAYLETGQPGVAVEVLKDTLEFDCPTWDDVHRAEILRRAAEEAEIANPFHSDLEYALEQRSENPKLLIMAALSSNARGETDRSEELMRKAIEFASELDRQVIPEFLAHYFQTLGRFSDAADQLAVVVNGVASHPSAIKLLVCLVRSARIRNALDWVREIRSADFPTPRIVTDIEVDLLHEAGDIGTAVARLEEICSRGDASSFDLVRLGAAQFRYGKQNDALETIDSIKTLELRDQPSYMLLLAQLKQQLDVSGYLDDAYLARQIGASHPDVHLGYFAMFQSQEKEWEEPTVVGPGCAVLLKDGTTEQWWHIQEESEEFGFPGFLAKDEELAQSLVGKRTGDVVLLKQGLEDLSYEVSAIQSKYVRAFQETFEEFTTRFPGNPGLFRVSFENNDFSKLYETVDHQHELSRRVTEMYEDGKLPLASFAHFLGQSEIEIWLSCTQSGSAKVRFGSGTAEIGTQVDRLLQAESIVLDLVALLSVRELGLSDFLRARFPRVAVPQLVIDEIQKQYSLVNGCSTGTRRLVGEIK